MIGQFIEVKALLGINVCSPLFKVRYEWLPTKIPGANKFFFITTFFFLMKGELVNNNNRNFASISKLTSFFSKFMSFEVRDYEFLNLETNSIALSSDLTIPRTPNYARVSSTKRAVSDHNTHIEPICRTKK